MHQPPNRIRQLLIVNVLIVNVLIVNVLTVNVLTVTLELQPTRLL